MRRMSAVLIRELASNSSSTALPQPRAPIPSSTVTSRRAPLARRIDDGNTNALRSQFLCSFFCLSDGCVIGQDGTVLLFRLFEGRWTDEFCLTNFQFAECGVQGNSKGLAAWIAQAYGTIHIYGGIEHVAQLVLVFGSHYLHIGDDAHKCDIEDAMLGMAVLANDASTVHGKDDMQILHADVVDDLVIGSLQECRIDGNYRAQA